MPGSMPDERAHRVNGGDFVRRTEREFWRDSDGAIRWTPALNDDGRPLIEDHSGAGETCSACGTGIRWLCYVRHPTRGALAVGRCCIFKVVKKLPEKEQLAYREAITNLDREIRNATRRSQGRPPILGRKEKLGAQIKALEAAARDPRIVGVRWFYNDNSHSLIRDVQWYLAELKAGRRRSGFQSALKAALARNGHPEVFA